MAVTGAEADAARASNVAAVFGTSWRIALLLWGLITATNLMLLLLDPANGVPRAGAWVTWVMLSVAAAAVFFPRDDPLGARWTWFVAALCVAAGSAVWWDPPSEASGYAPWYVRSATTVIVVLVLRRRPAAAWCGMAAIVSAVLIWAAVSGEQVTSWIGLLSRQMATIVVIQVTAVGLGWAARTIAAYRAEERERVRSEELRSASVRARKVELGAIRALGTPVLERIANGEDDPELRAEAILVEAALRDVLRGRRLAGEPLTSAVLEARQRGVDVTLLDDLDDRGATELAEDQRDAALTWAGDRVRATTALTATVRLSRRAGRPIVTVLAGDDDVASREF